jgi:PhnB protein
VDGNTSLSVMLIVSDADEAVQWYEQALGAKVLWDLGGVAGLHLAGAPFFIHEAVPGKRHEPSPSEAGMTTARIEVFTDDADALIDRAVAFGATDAEPVTDHETSFGNHRQGGFTDPFGHRWSVGDHTPLGGLAKPPQGP